MSTFVVTFEQFKGMVAEFCKAAPEAEEESLDNGMKAVILGYLGLVPETKTVEQHLAVTYYEFANRRYHERMMAIARLEVS